MSYSHIYDFPLSPHYHFRYRSRKKYRLGNRGVAVLNGLAELYFLRWLRHEPPTLAEWVREARRVAKLAQADGSCLALNLVLRRSANLRLCLLALWLRGHCSRSSVGIELFAPFRDCPQDIVRREAARTLKRMGAWAALREIAESDPNPRIRAIATPDGPRAHGDRLARFTRNFVGLNLTLPARDLFVAPNLDLKKGQHAPKSATVIRQILQRIQRVIASQVGW